MKLKGGFFLLDPSGVSTTDGVHSTVRNLHIVTKGHHIAADFEPPDELALLTVNRVFGVVRQRRVGGYSEVKCGGLPSYSFDIIILQIYIEVDLQVQLP